MAATTVTFSTVGGKVVSNAIVPTGNQLVLQIQFEKKGACVLQRRITDDVEWFDYAVLTSKGYGNDMFITTISGITIGEKLRIRFSGDATPSSIEMLEE